MASMDKVLDLLRRSDGSFRGTQHRQRRVLLTLALTVGPIYLGTLVLAVVLLIRTWQGGDWLVEFWGPFAATAPFSTSLIRVAIYDDDRKPLFAPAAELRNAVRRADDAVAPKVEPPAGASEISAPSPFSGGRIGPVRRTTSMAGLVAIICGVAVLVVLAIWVPAFLSTGVGDVGVRGAGISTAALLPLACLLFLYGARAYGRFTINLDAAGLRWRTPGGQRVRLTWADAYALFEVHRTASLATNPETQYAALGTRSALAWRLPNARAESRERTSSAEQCRAITEHAGLPLRDVTAEAMRVVGQAKQTPLGPKNRAGVPKVEVRRRFKMLGIIASPVLVVGLVAGGLQIYQPHYYENLYTQARAHAPTYTDPLTSDMGNWPTGSHASFAGGACNFALDDQTWQVDELAPKTNDNSLIEVTTRDCPSDGIGGPRFIFYDAQDENHSLTFRVTSEGKYWIQPYNILSDANTAPFIQSAAAIVTGCNATNRLAV